MALYAINVAPFALVLAAYALVAPGVGAAGLSMWLAFAVAALHRGAAVGEAGVLGVRDRLFQSHLAHAGYVRPRRTAVARFAGSGSNRALGSLSRRSDQPPNQPSANLLLPPPGPT